MVERVVLMGAEDVERAGRSISGAADVMQRAADSIDRSSDFLGRHMQEETNRIVAALAEQDAEQPTLRDRFAMAALSGSLGGVPGAHLRPTNVARDAYEYADAMLKARQS